jgi:hypothetical protein
VFQRVQQALASDLVDQESDRGGHRDVVYVEMEVDTRVASNFVRERLERLG